MHGICLEHVDALCSSAVLQRRLFAVLYIRIPRLVSYATRRPASAVLRSVGRFRSEDSSNTCMDGDYGGKGKWDPRRMLNKA